MKRRLHPALLIGGSALLLLLAVWLAPQVSHHGMSGERARQVLTDLHRPRAVFGAIAGFGLALAGYAIYRRRRAA